MLLHGLALVLALMSILAVAETVMPFRRNGTWRRDHLRANLGLTAGTLALNIGLGAAAAIGSDVLVARGAGLLPARALPWPALLILGVVVLDLCTYVAHRLMHHSSVLWRVHRVHHADPLVDVTTAYRQHPFETLLRFAFLAVPAWILGLPASVIAAYRLLSATNALLEHTNVRLWPPLDVMLSGVFVSPNMHKVHHSRRPAETDSNYGNILAVFDRLFRTFTPGARAAGVEYGLEGYDRPDTQALAALLRLPFEERPAAPPAGLDTPRHE
jgi:sterol desaturase/sphingolipid hydroxylase (fatty acid hydroxylase superfamily)